MRLLRYASGHMAVCYAPRDRSWTVRIEIWRQWLEDPEIWLPVDSPLLVGVA